MTLDELKKRRQWVCWKLEQKDGRPTKIPYGADGFAIGTNEKYRPRWTTFEEAISAAARFSLICLQSMI